MTGAERSDGKMRKSRGFTAISMVITMAVILVLVWIFFTYGTRRGGVGVTVEGPPEQAIGQAKGVVCRSNLKQVREAISMAQMGDPDQHFPRSLEELKLPADLTRCPVTGEEYGYDPATGKVWCNYPQHRGY